MFVPIKTCAMWLNKVCTYFYLVCLLGIPTFTNLYDLGGYFKITYVVA